MGLYYPGTYTICHRPAASDVNPRPLWREQVKFHLLDPTPEHCSYMRNDSSVHGYVHCELDVNGTVPFFDGFVNHMNNGSVAQSHRCTADCSECLSLGGRCSCYGAGSQGTCEACNACTEAQRLNQNCTCT